MTETSVLINFSDLSEWSNKVTVFVAYRKDSENYELVAVGRES